MIYRVLYIPGRWLFGISEPSLVSHKGANSTLAVRVSPKPVAPKELGILILLLHRLPVVPTIRLPSLFVEKQGPPNGRCPPEMAPGKLGKWQGKLGNGRESWDMSSSKEARLRKDHWTFLSVLDALTAHECTDSPTAKKCHPRKKWKKNKKPRNPIHSLCFKTVP